MLTSLQVLTKIFDALRVINLGFPNYCLGHGLMDLAYNQYLTEYYTQIGIIHSFVMFKIPKQEIMPLNGKEMPKVANVNFVPSVWGKQNAKDTILPSLKFIPVGIRRMGAGTCIQCARFHLCEVVNLSVCLSAAVVSYNVVVYL